MYVHKDLPRPEGRGTDEESEPPWSRDAVTGMLIEGDGVIDDRLGNTILSLQR